MEASIHFDQASYARMVGDMKSLVNGLKWTYPRALAYAGTLYARSLAGGTKIAKKLRKVIENPDPRAGNDNRVALFGVMRLRQEKPPKFIPIHRTGEFGKIRFQSKKSAVWLVRDSVTGEVRRETAETGTGEFQMAGIMQSKKRVIGRRGLAKKSWQWMSTHTRKGGAANILDTPEAARVSHRGQGAAHTLILTNRLSYILKASKDGIDGVDGAMMRAADGMRHEVDKKLRAAGAR